MKKFILAGLVVAMLTACSSEPETGTINADEFNKLEKGMSYEEVQEVVGGAAESENENDNITEYRYTAENGVAEEAHVDLLFIDGSLDTIMESGLLSEVEEDDRELLSTIDYEVTEENEDAEKGTKHIRVNMPDSEQHLYTFTPEDVAVHLYDRFKDDGHEGIWIYVHNSNGELRLATRGAYTNRGLAMTGADEIGVLITD